jgi:hypothetical protein
MIIKASTIKSITNKLINWSLVDMEGKERNQFVMT